MSDVNKLWIEGYVFALSEEKYSYSIIQKRCEMHGIKISKCKISNIINRKGKNRQSLFLHGKKTPNEYPKKVRTVSNVSKVKSLVTRENPPTQKSIAKSLDTSVATINKIINQDLQLKKAKKHNVHQLLPRHVAQRKTFCRILYENHLAGDKWKYIVTLDEAWVYLNDCNKKRSIYYRKRGEKNVQTWFRQCKESFSKGFMIVAGFSYNGKLKIRRVEKNVKINSSYYQEKVLRPIFTEEIPLLYPNDFQRVKLHQDKATSHTSKTTTAFLEKMKTDTGIAYIPFQHIPAKSPDVSPMDYCAFGLLKRALSKRKPTTIDGLWKVVEEEWKAIPLEILRKALLSWKSRCRLIVQKKGYQIEHLKK